MTAEASVIAATASALAAEASCLLEPATSATSLLAGHATSTTATLPIISLESFVPSAAQREATSESPATEIFTTLLFTTTSLSTSLIATDGHTIASVTPVISTGVITVPVSTISANGASSSTISKTKIGADVLGAVMAAVVVLVAIILIFGFYRLHIRKKASVKRKMSEFGLDYPPRPQPFLVGSLPRPPSSIVTPPTRPSRIFSTALSADRSSNSADLGFTASVAFATGGESVQSSFVDEKTVLKESEQHTNSRSAPGNIVLHDRSPSVHSSLYSPSPVYTSERPPSYRAT